MPRYLLDTNILLRSSDPDSPRYHLVSESVDRLVLQGNSCVITAQVLVELWVVATRPIAVNGLGWTPEQTHIKIEQLLSQFDLLPETDAIFTGTEGSGTVKALCVHAEDEESGSRARVNGQSPEI